MKTPEVLDKMADIILAYRPKKKNRPRKRRPQEGTSNRELFPSNSHRPTEFVQ